jgi:hypothetical protein
MQHEWDYYAVRGSGGKSGWGTCGGWVLFALRSMTLQALVSFEHEAYDGPLASHTSPVKGVHTAVAPHMHESRFASVPVCSSHGFPTNAAQKQSKLFFPQSGGTLPEMFFVLSLYLLIQMS